MMRKQYKWLAVALAVLCVAAQAVVVVPHHHHGDTEAPCFNIVHCVQHDDSHDDGSAGCCHDHCAPEQAPVSDHGCNVKVDAAEMQTFKSQRCPICELAAVNDFFAPEALVPGGRINTLHSFTLTRWRQQPVAVDKYALFVAEVHSARAPSFHI